MVWSELLTPLGGIQRHPVPIRSRGRRQSICVGSLTKSSKSRETLSKQPVNNTQRMRSVDSRRRRRSHRFRSWTKRKCCYCRHFTVSQSSGRAKSFCAIHKRCAHRYAGFIDTRSPAGVTALCKSISPNELPCIASQGRVDRPNCYVWIV